MIVTFKNLRTDWVINNNIEVAKQICKKLQIGYPPPSIAILQDNPPYYLYEKFSGPGTYVIIFAHGDEYKINNYDSNNFSNLYRRITSAKKKRVILISCKAGKANLAQQIADNLQVQVLAPKGNTIFGEEGLAVIKEQCVNEVRKEQNRLKEIYDTQTQAPQIFKGLIEFVKIHSYGTVKSWEFITDPFLQAKELGLNIFYPTI